MDAPLIVKLESESARVPVRASQDAAGYDLSSVDTHVLHPGARVVVSTGLVITLPPGTYGRIAPRSGLAVTHGITVLGGIVDRDYTGTVKVILHNTGRQPFNVFPGTRIAQLVLERIATPEVVVTTDTVQHTARGASGFGSTGMHEVRGPAHGPPLGPSHGPPPGPPIGPPIGPPLDVRIDIPPPPPLQQPNYMPPGFGHPPPVHTLPHPTLRF